MIICVFMSFATNATWANFPAHIRVEKSSYHFFYARCIYYKDDGRTVLLFDFSSIPF